LSTLLLVPLDDTVVFPNMNVTISADVGDEDRGPTNTLFFTAGPDDETHGLFGRITAG